MIFRLTLKLAKKIGIAPLHAISYDENRNPLMDWNAHLFTAQRSQYIILTNTASLYSMVMYGRGITNEKQFIQVVLPYMKEFMTIDGNEVIYEKLIELMKQSISFSKIVDRRVLGSMNDLIFQAKIRLIEGQQSPFNVSFMLNESPMSYLNYAHPKDEFQKLFFQKGESAGNRQIQSNVINFSTARLPKTQQ